MKKQSRHTRSGNASTLDVSSRRRVDRTRKNSVANPLTQYLEEERDADSRLSRLAQQMSRRPVDLNRCRAELLDKLRRVPYSQPRDPDRRKKTFHDRMKRDRALPAFLRTSTLCRIWGWLLLRDIIRTDRELENRKLSIERCPLHFHSFLTSELSRHERAITAGISKYKIDEGWLNEYLSAVNREKMRQLRILSLSRWPGLRGPLLEGFRDEGMTAEVGIFEVLKQCFAGALSDRFRRRLSQLVCAPPGANSISNERDEALRMALARRP